MISSSAIGRVWPASVPSTPAVGGLLDDTHVQKLVGLLG